jgi:hypothetical protein
MESMILSLGDFFIVSIAVIFTVVVIRVTAAFFDWYWRAWLGNNWQGIIFCFEGWVATYYIMKIWELLI